MRRTAIILAWLLIFSIPAFGQDETETETATDTRAELQKQLDAADDKTERLKLLYKLAAITRGDDSEALYYTKLLEKEAEDQKNYKYLSSAYIIRMSIAYNSYDIKTIERYMGLLEPLARKNKFYDDLFKGRRCILDMLVLTGNHEKSEREAKIMLKEAEELKNISGIMLAHQSLATTYRMTYRAKEAVVLLNKGYEMALSIDNFGAASEIMEALIMTYRDIDDYDNSLKTIAKYEALTKKIEAEQLENKTFTNISFFSIYLSYSIYYMTFNNIPKADSYLNQAKEYYSETLSPIYRCNYHLIGYSYYEKTGNYEKALVEINAGLRLLKELGVFYDYYKSVFSKANTLYKMERYDDALTAYKQNLSLNDSLQLSTINKQHEQLKQYFNEDQLLLENAQIRHRMLLFTIMFLGLVLLTVIYVIIHTYRSGKLLRKNEQEIYRATCEVEAANAAKDGFLSNINIAIRKPLNEVVEGSILLAGDTRMTKDESRALSATIQTKSAALMQLINDILDLSRLEAGMMKFMYADNELLSIIDSAASTVKSDTGENVVVSLPQNELYMINIDGGRLQQVFQCLFSKKSGESPVSAKVEYIAGAIRITVIGSALSAAEPPQETIIRNEINRMLLEEFGGHYTIHSSGEVEITIKPDQTIRMD